MVSKKKFDEARIEMQVVKDVGNGDKLEKSEILQHISSIRNLEGGEI